MHFPVTHLTDELTVIRPLMLVSEADVRDSATSISPVCKNPCPMDGHTGICKNLIRTLNADSPGVRERLFHAVTTGNIDGWPDHIK